MKTARTPRRTKAQRQAWWASLTPAEQAAYIERRAAYKSAHMSPAALEATARVTLAREQHCFMAEVADEDVAARMREMRATDTA
jgi:hypothetical protein